MPKYFFDCFDGSAFHGDKHGIDLESVDDAADQGACLATDLLREATGSVGSRAVSVIVRTATGERVYVAHCSFSGFRALE